MNQFVMLGCLWLGACATAFFPATDQWSELSVRPDAVSA